MKQYYFISGLPRSGSTLLSTILKQNPNFHSGITSSLLPHARSAIENGNKTISSEVDDERTKRMFMTAFDAYYYNVNKPVVFDTNRMWTNLLPQLKDSFPYTKVICCVRDINWIIDSFERLHQKNPYKISSVFPETVDLNVYTRSESLMDGGGVVRVPYDSLKSAICGMYSDMILLVEYELLCKNPEGTMRTIYNFIGQPFYQHDFNQVEESYDEYDNDLRMKGLHTTKRKVEYSPRNFVLPPDVLNKFSDLEVWRKM